MSLLKKIRIPVIFFLALSIGVLSSYQLPDDGLLHEITSKFTKYTESYPQHKIYLHTDKPYYATGDIIWFKAYQLNGSSHEPYGRNKVIYTELINEKAEIVAREKLNVAQGFASGDFLLSDSLASGQYTIRAYNSWMRNFDPAFFFYKSIQIFNINQPEQIAAKPTGANLNQIDLQFFPESGNLVNGIESKIAFKAVNSNGEATDIQGIITDETGDTINSFKSLHLGMGAFRLQPQAGKQYTANIRLADSAVINYNLPEALSEGIVMAVDNASEESLKVQVISSDPSQINPMVLIAQVRGQIYYSEQFNLQGKAAMEIPKKNFPNGIVQFTLFDNTGNAQCERLVFVNHENDLQIRVSTDKKVYAPREKVAMQIEVSDHQGKPVNAHLSMAITDAHQVAAEPFNQNILTYLLLGSDLKGTVEEPGFYFQKNNPDARQALDHLLLTQGWRRFIWKEVLSDTYREIRYETEDGITLAGKLLQGAGKNPEANQFISLSAPGGRPAFQHQYTDEEGNFYFTGLDYRRDKQLMLQVYSLGTQPVRTIELDTLAPVQKSQFNRQTAITQKITHFLEKSRMIRKIETVYPTDGNGEDIIDTLQQLQNTYPKRVYAIADVPADHHIELDKYNEFPDMTEVLREIVPGVLLKNKKGVNSLKVLNIKSKLYFKEEPVYFIDGVPARDASLLFKLDPGMVETIEVYGKPEKLTRFDFLGRNGVIAVFTRTGDFYPQNKEGSFTIPLNGYYQTREFYSPAYEKNPGRTKRPDFRTVLYWNPNISTGTSGKATIAFFAADNITSYQAIIEGISDKGIPGAGKHIFQVKLPLQSKK